jgi:Resolvase, N terminal domain
MRRIGIYLRVSTNGQTTESQRRELEAVAARSGWLVQVYEDAGISAEQKHRLWWSVRRASPVQWVSICIVLAMVAALFWLAIYFSRPPQAFERALWRRCWRQGPPWRAPAGTCTTSCMK